MRQLGAKNFDAVRSEPFRVTLRCALADVVDNAKARAIVVRKLTGS